MDCFFMSFAYTFFLDLMADKWRFHYCKMLLLFSRVNSSLLCALQQRCYSSSYMYLCFQAQSGFVVAFLTISQCLKHFAVDKRLDTFCKMCITVHVCLSCFFPVANEECVCPTKPVRKEEDRGYTHLRFMAQGPSTCRVIFWSRERPCIYLFHLPGHVAVCTGTNPLICTELKLLRNFLTVTVVTKHRCGNKTTWVWIPADVTLCKILHFFVFWLPHL